MRRVRPDENPAVRESVRERREPTLEDRRHERIDAARQRIRLDTLTTELRRPAGAAEQFGRRDSPGEWTESSLLDGVQEPEGSENP